MGFGYDDDKSSCEIVDEENELNKRISNEKDDLIQSLKQENVKLQEQLSRMREAVARTKCYCIKSNGPTVICTRCDALSTYSPDWMEGKLREAEAKGMIRAVKMWCEGCNLGHRVTDGPGGKWHILENGDLYGACDMQRIVRESAQLQGLAWRGRCGSVRCIERSMCSSCANDKLYVEAARLSEGEG